MKKLTTISILVLAIALMPVASFANEASYNAKCKACHGADGKKLAKADLTSEAIQAKADNVLVKFLLEDAKHKTKVADEATAKSLITYMKTLKK